MAKKINISSLFNRSGCLNENAIVAYLAGKLEGKDLKHVEEHLKECSLCRDAVEGASMVGPVKYLEDLSQLRTKIDLQFKGKDKIHRLRNISFIAAAASVLILAGVFFLFNKMQFSEKKRIAVTSQAEEDNILEKNANNKEFKPESEALQPSVEKRKEIIPVPQAPQNVETDQLIENDESIPEIQQHSVLQEFESSEEAKAEQPASLVASGASASSPAGQEMEGTIDTKSTSKKSSNERNIINANLSDKEESPRREKAVEMETTVHFDSEMPKFKGGGTDKFARLIQDSLKTNDIFLHSGFNGNILASFAVDTSGKLENINLMNVPDTRLHQELLRIFRNSPKWTPGLENGKKVNKTLTISIETNQ